jgi:solute carrier family 41
VLKICLFLGIVMIAVILASKKFNINPDNVATPIAASMGDLITITLLSWIASLLFEAIGKKFKICFLLKYIQFI